MLASVKLFSLSHPASSCNQSKTTGDKKLTFKTLRTLATLGRNRWNSNPIPRQRVIDIIVVRMFLNGIVVFVSL